MKKLIASSIAILLVVYGFTSSDGFAQFQKKDRQPIMQQKLEEAKGLLEGIALKDFDLIGKHADNMLALTAKAEWMIFPTAEYTRWTNQFRSDVEMIARAAKEKNLDGAVLGYVQMTTNCVNCHKRVREVRMVSLED